MAYRSVILIAAIMLTAASMSFAGYGAGGGISRPAPTPQPAPAPRPDNSAQIKQLNEAVVAHNKAQADLAAVTTKLRATFDAAPANSGTVTAFRSNQSAYNARLAIVTAEPKADPKYQQALASRSGAQQKLETLRAVKPPPEADIAETTNALLAAMADVKRLEDRAATNDDQLTRLRSYLAESSQRMAVLQKDFDASLPANQEWASAKANLDSAKSRLDGLRKTK